MVALRHTVWQTKRCQSQSQGQNHIICQHIALKDEGHGRCTAKILSQEPEATSAMM